MKEKVVTGTVVNLGTGVGWIEPDGSRQRVFFHYTSLETVKFAELGIGERVAFTVVDYCKTPRAIRVRQIME